MKNIGGSIYQDKRSGRWVYKGAPGKDGKRVYKSFAREEQAQAYRNYICANLGITPKAPRVDMTVREGFEMWRRLEWQNEDVISLSTARGYDGYFKTHLLPYIGEQPLAYIDFTPVNKHLVEMVEAGRKLKTVRNIRQALMFFLGYATESNWCPPYAEDCVRVPTSRKYRTRERQNRERIVNVLSESEFRRVWEKMCEADISRSYVQAVFLFLRASGIRIEELCITWDDVDRKNGYICINKACKRAVDPETGKSRLVVSPVLKSSAAYRKIPLTDKLNFALSLMDHYRIENNIEDAEYVFCTKKGTLLEPRNLLRMFHRYLDLCGLEHRGLHSLRKLYCKAMRDEGLDWERLSRIMGHETPAVTKGYYYSLDTDDYLEMSQMAG